MHTLHSRELLGGLLGIPDVVAVDERDQVATCVIESDVSRVRGSGVRGRRQQPDAWISLLVSGNDILGRVGGAVVHHNQLPVLDSLGDDGIDGLGDVALGVVGRHDYSQ